MIGRLDVVKNIVEENLGHVAAPIGHRTLEELCVGLEAVITHPVGLALHPRHLFDDVFVEATFGLKDVILSVAPAEFVPAEVKIKFGAGHQGAPGGWSR